MKKHLMLIVLAVLGLVVPVNAAYYLAGDFNTWNAAGTLMTETSAGVWSVTLSGLTAGRHEFKVTDGTWTWSYPGANSWLYADASGTITVTFNTNTVSDGWQPTQNRLGLSVDPVTWTVAGSFQGWSNNNPATMMTSLGHGFHKFTLPAGNITFKPVITGTWDSISWDNRSVGTKDYSLNSSQPTDFYVDALTGTVGIGVEITRDYLSHDPAPANSAEGVLVSGLQLSWAVAKERSQADPNIFVADPNLVSHKLYMSHGSGMDPNLYYVGTVTGWDTGTLRASYTPSPVLNKDSTYQWRVDMVMNDSNDIRGFVWTFSTEITTPTVTGITPYQVVAAATPAAFTVTVSSVSTPTYQWYKDNGDGVSNPATDTLLTGKTTATLTIPSVLSINEGKYYCVVNNDSGVPATSVQVPLAIKAKLAHWGFESGNANSTVVGSPVSVFYGDPAFAVSGGIAGDGMAFDNDAGAEDILYTDPDRASYFDICNYTMTVACWIKSSSAATWGPMVARNGELGEAGWQLRHSGYSLDRVCFTTRGTGNDDGSVSNRAVYDGKWHYVVATYDGTEKKVYIDGVVSRVYNGDDGSIARNSDAVSGLINASLSPVALAGRVKGDPISGLVFDGASVTACILDEVEIYNYTLDAAAIAHIYANITHTAVCPTPQVYDLNGDCIVNLADLALLASQWLSNISVQPAP